MPMPAADPWSAAFGAVAGMGTAAIDDKTNLTQSTKTDTRFDNSNWNVNIGSGTASPTQMSKASPLDAATSGIGGLLSNPLVLIGIGLAVYWAVKK